MIRILFFVLLLCVGGVYSLGQGWLGTPPSEEGRQPLKATQEVQADAVTLLPPKP